MTTSDALCQRYEIGVAEKIILDKGPNINLQDGCPTNVNCSGSTITTNSSSSSSSSMKENGKHLSHDWQRSSHVAITGLTLSGPISHAWYNVLERMVTTRHRYFGVALRMVLDAVLFSPVAVAGYFTWRSALEGKGWNCIREKLEAKWSKALMASWSYWPVANVISFSFVPVQFRVLYNNVLSLFFNGYLSHINGTRMDEITSERIENPEIFVPQQQQQQSEQDRRTKHINISKAEERANGIICVCPHCRADRA
eukprot:CAMPEP_0113474498 /NCGR_PEP_ID=MMETSP0014_2-20120614/18619_1 /TAXON_ID=2857 /ORGANISM="Nitzschia sp." /LENGTH=253 /DNA_ID=CAMNT_0000367355 /DNA_START=91 /DNA_END=852 /DNA_ORIENTATION=- /assembly_acc=CAM_ASM_000159